MATSSGVQSPSPSSAAERAARRYRLYHDARPVPRPVLNPGFVLAVGQSHGDEAGPQVVNADRPPVLRSLEELGPCNPRLGEVLSEAPGEHRTFGHGMKLRVIGLAFVDSQPSAGEVDTAPGELAANLDPIWQEGKTDTGDRESCPLVPKLHWAPNG